MDDLAYKIAAAEMAGNVKLATDLAASAGSQFPGFDAERFIAASAYTDTAYRDALAKPLLQAMARVAS